MHREKRERIARQQFDASQVVQQKAQALRGRGFGRGKAKGQQVDGENIDDLIEYVQALENRIAGLESALNLDIKPPLKKDTPPSRMGRNTI